MAALAPKVAHIDDDPADGQRRRTGSVARITLAARQS